jgi:type II secretory pathway pseudopilin PulG
MRRHGTFGARGFSLVEALVVVLLGAAAVAVAARPIAGAYRDGQLQAGVAQARAVIHRRAVDATRGERQQLDLAEIPLPSRVLVNPRGLAPPPGTTSSDRVEFRGQRGSALIENRPARAAWVFVHEAAPDMAYAVVVGSSALVEDWVYEGREWRKR